MAKERTALDPVVGRALGHRRYEVVARIARGGMATVYRAHDRRLDRQVAIKVPRPEYARDQAFAEQFRREARAAARLAHPNIVAVYDSGVDRGTPWIAMELVDGPTLRELLDAHGQLDVATTATLLAGIADALDSAHHAGVAHLDVKPENILLAGSTPKIADFGLVRAAHAGRAHAPAGSVHYLAPEVIAGGVVDGRADVYALGVVAYECLAGRPPFPGERDTVLARHVNDRVPPPSWIVPGLPASIDAAVLRATEPAPACRFGSATDLTVALGAPRRLPVAPPVAVPPAPATGPGAIAAPTVPGPPAAAGAPTVRHDAAAPTLRHPGPARTARHQPASAPVRQVPGAPTSPTQAGPPRWTSWSDGALAGGPAPAPPAVPPVVRPTTRTGPRPRRRRGRLPLVLLFGFLLALAALVMARGGLLPALLPRVAVPSVVGLTPGAARARLERSGLAAADGPSLYSRSFRQGLVASQSVRPGARLERGSVVDLELSAGPPFVTLPVVGGLAPAQAERALRAAGVGVTVRRVPNAAVPAGVVVRAAPPGGWRVRAGSMVTLLVSSGPPGVIVPNVVGDTRGAASAALARAGLQASFPFLSFGSRVNGQSPAPGTSVPPRTTVDLSVPFF